MSTKEAQLKWAREERDRSIRERVAAENRIAIIDGIIESFLFYLLQKSHMYFLIEIHPQ